MANEATTVGERIRAARKMRGFTARQLADAVNISIPLLYKYEQGTRNPSNRMVIELAKALHIGPERLTGQPYMNGAEAESGVQAVIPDLRRVLWTYDRPEESEAAPRPLEILVAEMKHISQMRRDCQYMPMGALLPSLLNELSQVALSSTGQRKEQAFSTLALGYRAANSLAHKLGYHDLSMTAIERVRWAAAHSGDPFMEVVAEYLMLGALLRQGTWDAADRLLIELESKVHRIVAGGPWDNTSRGLLGSLVLKHVALKARKGDVEGAMRAVEDAEEIAAASGNVDGVYYETSFGPANIRIHEVHAHLELGAPSIAVERAEGFEPPEDMPGERRSHHYIDLAAAQLASGDRAGSFESLRRARSISPLHTRFHPVVRHTSAALVRLDRAQHDTIAGFARWSGAI
jgi:transcriptional regulator with XRE-family HTH domain